MSLYDILKFRRVIDIFHTFMAGNVEVVGIANGNNVFSYFRIQGSLRKSWQLPTCPFPKDRITYV
jgi:hypothetical protein